VICPTRPHQYDSSCLPPPNLPHKRASPAEIETSAIPTPYHDIPSTFATSHAIPPPPVRVCCSNTFNPDLGCVSGLDSASTLAYSLEFATLPPDF
jgi:hypothetical protein